MIARIRSSDTFLSYYLDYAEALETHVLFDLWCGLWILSNVAGRHCVLQRGGIPIHLNLYLLLIAESGVARKSTASSLARSVLSSYYRHSGDAPTWITSRLSPERIVKEARGGHLIFHAGELVTLLGKSSYAYQLPGMLTDLYDCPQDYRWGSDPESGMLRDVYPTLLGASTPAWLVRAINPDVIEGGFTSRCIVVMADGGKGRRAWPEGDVSLDTFVGGCCERLERVVMQAAIQLDQRAKSAYETWYNSRTLSSSSPYLQSFESREHDHILRTAALLSLDRGADSVDALSVASAHTLVSLSKAQGSGVFAGLGRNPDDRGLREGQRLDTLIEGIRDYFVDRGLDFTPQTVVTMRFAKWANAGGLRNVLDAMCDLDMVQRVYDTKRSGGMRYRRGRPTMLWRGTTKLLEMNTEMVASKVDRSRL